MADADSIRCKVCTKCKQSKPASEFNKNRSKPDGLGTECRPCANAYCLQHFEKHREAYSATMKAHYRANADAYKERARKWEAENAERKRELRREGYYRNRESLLERGRESWQRHKAKRAETKKAYRQANSARAMEHVRARQARKLRAMPEWADRVAIRAVYDECRRISEATGIKHHVDHFYPLQSPVVCGLHNEFNLRIIPAAENQSKGNKLIEAE